MVVKIELENLEELENVVQCLEYCVKNEQDVNKPEDREIVKKIAEKLRNEFEEFSDLEKEKD